MKSFRSPLIKTSTRAPTGMAGFDEITGGGLPRGPHRAAGGRTWLRQDHIRVAIPEAWRAGFQGAGNFLAFEETTMDELRRRRDATSGREMRIVYLKHEVNELLGQTGHVPRYPCAESQDQTEK